MIAPTATDLDCVAVIDDTFEAVFASIDGWRSRIESVVSADEGAIGVAEVDELVESLVVPRLSAEGALVIGAGFVASPGFIRDAPWHLAWWLGHANTFGVTGPALPELRRLIAVEDEHSEAFRDYTTLEWWRVPSTTRRRHITGPYVDYLCTDDYTLTLTSPAFYDGAMIGVVGADLYVNDIERTLLPAVRGVGERTALVNASGRVVVATDSSRPTGSLIRPAAWDQYERVVPCGSGLVLLVG
jgi:hypothetical protein